MSLLIELLDMHLFHIEKSQPNFRKMLQPGLSKSEVQELTQDFPYELPDEVYELYSWHNGVIGEFGEDGTGLGGQGYFFDVYNFNTVKQAMFWYKGGRSHNDSSFWKPDWFPIAEFNTNCFYIVPCAKSSKILEVYLGSTIHRVLYSSITSMMITSVECWEQGIYYSDPLGSISCISQIARDRIRRKNNRI